MLSGNWLNWKKHMLKTKPTLTERIAQLQTEIDKLLDEHAAETAKECPGIPIPNICALLTNRAPGCQCRQAINLMNEGEK